MSEKREYQEEHFQYVSDVGIAFNHDRIWVCINGESILRAKWMNGKLQVEYHKPEFTQCSHMCVKCDGNIEKESPHYQLCCKCFAEGLKNADT